MVWFYKEGISKDIAPLSVRFLHSLHQSEVLFDGKHGRIGAGDENFGKFCEEKGFFVDEEIEDAIYTLQFFCFGLRGQSLVLFAF